MEQESHVWDEVERNWHFSLHGGTSAIETPRYASKGASEEGKAKAHLQTWPEEWEEAWLIEQEGSLSLRTSSLCILI